MRTPATPLGVLLLGQTRGRVLALLYGRSDQPFFVRQIARETGTSVGTVQRELETLFEHGLIDRTTLGRQVFYQANRNHPVFAELHSLVAKTSGVYHLLRSALSPLANKITFAFVYGSMARGEEDADSDVDLMVIGSLTLDDLLTRLASAEHDIGRPINPTIYSLKEFKAKMRAGNHFLSSIVRGKNIFLIGEEDEFRKMA